MKKLSFIFLCGSCENESNDLKIEPDEFFVTQDELLSLLDRPQSSSSKSTNSSQNTVEKILPLIDDVTKEVLMYIVNYSDKGFMIIAADERVEPILAYSYDTKFDLSEEIDQGLASWFETKIDYIDYVKNNVLEPLPEVIKQWNALAHVPEHFENPNNNCDFLTTTHTNLY